MGKPIPYIAQDDPAVAHRHRRNAAEPRLHAACGSTAKNMKGATGRVREGLSRFRGRSLPAVLGTFAAHKYRVGAGRAQALPYRSCRRHTILQSLSLAYARQLPLHKGA